MGDTSNLLLERGLTLGSGPRYSASAGLLAYGVSRLALVTVWGLGDPTGSTLSLALRVASYFFTASIGLASIALALVIVHAPSLTRRHVRLFGLLLLSVGALRIVVNLSGFLSFPSQPPFYADIAYSLLSIYLGAGLLIGSLSLGRTTFIALALLTVAALLRSVQIDNLFLAPFRGTYLSIFWLRQLLYAVSMGLAFVAFASVTRWAHVDLYGLMRSREYVLLWGAMLLYGLGELVIFADTYVLRFDQFMARAAEYLGTAYYVITVYLWPLLDTIFVLSLIAFAVSMRQTRFQQIGTSRDGEA